MMARCKELHFVTDSHMAEAYAPREGLRQAQQIGSDKFNLQSNNIQMIETMKNGGYVWEANEAPYELASLISMIVLIIFGITIPWFFFYFQSSQTINDVTMFNYQ
jgi:hypothetical protein